MIYFTADTHFNHANIIRYCNRPFNDVEEMNKTIMANWNSIVRPKDEIYILGDLMFTNNREELAAIVGKLNGVKYLIKGNHDKDGLCEGLFEWVKDYYVLNHGGVKFVMFHYPILEWDGFYKGDRIHLYGHVHNHNPEDDPGHHLNALIGKRAFNVGVDVNGFCPVKAERIIDEIAQISS